MGRHHSSGMVENLASQNPQNNGSQRAMIQSLRPGQIVFPARPLPLKGNGRLGRDIHRQNETALCVARGKSDAALLEHGRQKTCREVFHEQIGTQNGIGHSRTHQETLSTAQECLLDRMHAQRARAPGLMHLARPHRLRDKRRHTQPLCDPS